MCLLLFGMLVPKVYAPVGPPPVITVQPLDRTVQEGDNVSFTVIASSATLITFKWYFDGKVCNGFGNGSPTLTISNVQPADAGAYAVEVKNAGGKVMSSNAVLTVRRAPLKCTSAAMATNGFTLSWSGPAGSNFVILTSTNLKDWTPLATNSAPSGSVSFTDPSVTNHPVRLYRARLQ